MAATVFAAENTLGKLAKWLKILGFDAQPNNGYIRFCRYFSGASNLDSLLLSR